MEESSFVYSEDFVVLQRNFFDSQKSGEAFSRQSRDPVKIQIEAPQIRRQVTTRKRVA